MQLDVFTKKPAFFPAINTEVFFEAESARDAGGLKLDTLDSNLDAELDRILAMANSASAKPSVPVQQPEPAVLAEA